MTDLIEFFVPGVPRPGGSKRAFPHKNTGKMVVIDMGGQATKDWRSLVASRGEEAMRERDPLDGPLFLSVIFTMPRPKKHRKGDRLRADAPYWHAQAPDATKLLRSLEDALRRIAWNDDSQVVLQHAAKVFGERPGAQITIRRMEDTS